LAYCLAVIGGNRVFFRVLNGVCLLCIFGGEIDLVYFKSSAPWKWHNIDGFTRPHFNVALIIGLFRVFIINAAALGLAVIDAACIGFAADLDRHGEFVIRAMAGGHFFCDDEAVRIFSVNGIFEKGKRRFTDDEIVYPMPNHIAVVIVNFCNSIHRGNFVLV